MKHYLLYFKALIVPIKEIRLAGWQSGHAEDCKSLYVGSIPVPASIISSKNPLIRAI